MINTYVATLSGYETLRFFVAEGLALGEDCLLLEGIRSLTGTSIDIPAGSIGDHTTTCDSSGQ